MRKACALPGCTRFVGLQARHNMCQKHLHLRPYCCCTRCKEILEREAQEKPPYHLVPDWDNPDLFNPISAKAFSKRKTWADGLIYTEEGLEHAYIMKLHEQRQGR